MVNDSELVKIRLENYSTTWGTQTCYVRFMPLSHDKRVQLTNNMSVMPFCHCMYVIYVTYKYDSHHISFFSYLHADSPSKMAFVP